MGMDEQHVELYQRSLEATLDEIINAQRSVVEPLAYRSDVHRIGHRSESPFNRS